MPLDPSAYYASIVSVRNLELDMRLRISQLFILLNVALMTIVGTIVASERFRELLFILLFLCFAGASLCYIWLMLSRRTTQWVRYRGERLGKMEETNEVDISVFSAEYEKVHEKDPHIFEITTYLISVFVFLWVLGAIIVLEAIL
jgi:hypothetical protein